MSEKTKSIIKRFVKAFLTGGASSILLAIAQAPSLNTLADLKVWILSLITAFLSGGIMAIEKTINWETDQTNL